MTNKTDEILDEWEKQAAINLSHDQIRDQSEAVLKLIRLVRAQREALEVYAYSKYVDVKQRCRGRDSDGTEYEDLEIDDDGTIARKALALSVEDLE